MLVKVKTSQEAYEMGYTEAKYGLKKENPFDKMKQSKFWNAYETGFEKGSERYE